MISNLTGCTAHSIARTSLTALEAGSFAGTVQSSFYPLRCVGTTLPSKRLTTNPRAIKRHHSNSVETSIMNLDANTPLGRAAIESSREGIGAFLKEHPSLRLIETDQQQPADVDGILHDGKVVRAVVELRTRYLTLDKMMDTYEGKWLVSYDKLERGRELAIALRCDFVGVIVLAPSSIALVKRLCDSSGEWTCAFTTAITNTKATVNSTAIDRRKNAFVDITTAKQYKL